MMTPLPFSALPSTPPSHFTPLQLASIPHNCSNAFPFSFHPQPESESEVEPDSHSDGVMTESSSGVVDDVSSDSAIASFSSISDLRVVHTFIKPGPNHASLAKQHVDAILASLPQVPLLFPEMGNPSLVLHPLSTASPVSNYSSNPSLPTSASPFPSYFPPPAQFHRGHTSLRLSLPFSHARSHRIHLYAVGNLIIDGRKYRVQGWLVRTSTLGVRDAEVLVSIDQPVMLVAKIEARTSTTELDYLEGELAVGKLGIVPSGWWRMYAVVAHGRGRAVTVSISPPTPRFHLSVADDWELSPDDLSCVSLADLVAFHNPHQISARAAAPLVPCSLPPVRTKSCLLHARTTPTALGHTERVAAANTPRLRTLSFASAIGYLTGTFSLSPRPASRSGSTSSLAVTRPMASQKQDEDLQPNYGDGFPGSFSTYSHQADQVGLVDENRSDEQREPETMIGLNEEMKPLRFAALPTRLESRVPVVHGIVQDSW